MNQVAAIMRSDKKAFEKVYHEFHQKIFCFFLRKTKGEETAKELTQQAFIKLWNGRNSLSADHSVDANCFTIAQSVLIDHFRKLAREEQHLQSLAQPGIFPGTPSTDPHCQFESEDLIETMADELPPVRRNVFILKINRGYSNKEIAEQLSISVKTVEDHYSKAIRQIRSVGLSILPLFFSMLS